jgi:hypothetical protein
VITIKVNILKPQTEVLRMMVMITLWASHCLYAIQFPFSPLQYTRSVRKVMRMEFLRSLRPWEGKGKSRSLTGGGPGIG